MPFRQRRSKYIDNSIQSLHWTPKRHLVVVKIVHKVTMELKISILISSAWLAGLFFQVFKNWIFWNKLKILILLWNVLTYKDSIGQKISWSPFKEIFNKLEVKKETNFSTIKNFKFFGTRIVHLMHHFALAIAIEDNDL